MTKEQAGILVLVNAAIDRFNVNEQYLISHDLSERCICSKFASYLEKAIVESPLSNYTVDVEYNRGYRGNENAVKALDGRNIVVDLIVHKRGYDQETGFNNLFCIEMKKEYKRVDLSSDKKRLERLTDNFYGFGYKMGFMIVAVINKRRKEYKLVIDSIFPKHKGLEWN